MGRPGLNGWSAQVTGGVPQCQVEADVLKGEGGVRVGEKDRYTWAI